MTRSKLASALIEGLEEVSRHVAGEHVEGIRIVDVRPTLKDRIEVSEIRAKTGLSQDKFAGLIGVSTKTLQGWEQNRRQPNGPARALLYVASVDPNFVVRTLGLNASKGQLAPKPRTATKKRA